MEIEEYYSVVCYYKILKNAIEKKSFVKEGDKDLKIRLLQLIEELMLKKKVTSREALENLLALFLIMMNKLEDHEFFTAVLLLVKSIFVVS